jgi:hypothetical protein
MFSGVKCCQKGGGVGNAEARGFAWGCSAIVGMPVARNAEQLKTNLVILKDRYGRLC